MVRAPHSSAEQASAENCFNKDLSDANDLLYLQWLLINSKRLNALDDAHLSVYVARRLFFITVVLFHGRMIKLDWSGRYELDR